MWNLGVDNRSKFFKVFQCILTFACMHVDLVAKIIHLIWKIPKITSPNITVENLILNAVGSGPMAQNSGQETHQRGPEHSSITQVLVTICTTPYQNKPPGFQTQQRYPWPPAFRNDLLVWTFGVEKVQVCVEYSCDNSFTLISLLLGYIICFFHWDKLYSLIDPTDNGTHSVQSATSRLLYSPSRAFMIPIL